METPIYAHLTSDDYKFVYEPSEDSFLLLDALEMELPYLKDKQPLLTVEIGPGSGIIIAALAKYLNYQSNGFFAVDINKFACGATQRTSRANGVNVEVVNMDLLTAFKPNSIDLLIFNPPYVPTEADDASNIPEQQKIYDKDAEAVYKSGGDDKLLIKSWAGGADGCEIINKVIFSLKHILAPGGTFYLLIIKDNNPEKIRKDLRNLGYKAEPIIDRKIRGEHLIVLKIEKL